MGFLAGSKRSFPGFDRIYHVQNPGSTREFVARGDLSPQEALAFLRGDARPEQPLWFAWYMGNAVPKDFVWTTVAIPFIVSQRVIDVLEHGGFSGWSTYPVEMIGRDNRHIDGYSGLVVRGRAGPIQRERSSVLEVPGPVGNRIRVFRGLLFDESLWDGSDLFMPDDDTGVVFVTDFVERAFKASRIRGAELTRADLDERPFF